MLKDLWGHRTKSNILFQIYLYFLVSKSEHVLLAYQGNTSLKTKYKTLFH